MLPETMVTASPEPSELASLVVLDREPGVFLFGQWENVLILAWSGQADGTVPPRLKKASAEVTARSPHGHSTVSIIAEGLPPPTEAAREGMTRLLSDKDSNLACLGVVVLGRGFGSSALRSTHTSMRLASSKSYEMKVMGTVEELTSWLVPRHLERTGVALDVDRLREVIAEARLGAAPNGAVVPQR